MIPSAESRLLYLDHIDARGRDFFQVVCEHDCEGVVGKWRQGRYHTDGASASWVKVKNPSYSQMTGRRELFEQRRDIRQRRRRGWKNPHVLLHLDVKGNDGVTVSWLLEARAAYIMRRMGLEQDFIKIGQAVELSVCVARDGSHKGGVGSVDLSGVTKPIGMCGNAQAAG